MKYLNGIRTLEELKKQYHMWAKRLHSDVGGSDDEMKKLNVEYEEIFPYVKDRHLNRDGDEYTRETNEAPDAFRKLIDALMRLNGIRIEIIGSFVWVTGDTRSHNTTLKGLGFKWHFKKKCWYLPPAGYRRYGGGEYDLDTIRGMYGVNYDEEVHLKELQVANR